VWHAETFENLYTIYSTFDVGDVFCVAFSSLLQTAWFGAQNTSIQWYDLQKKDRRRPSLTSHPSKRIHRFFDSKGPGGRCTPRPEEDGVVSVASTAMKMLEVEPSNIVQYAHFGYVYCMLLVPASQIGQGEGEVLLSGGGDGDVKLWSIDDATGGISELQTLRGGDSGVLSMVVKDTLLYCGLTDGEICIWDLDTLQLVRTVKAHCDDVLTLSVKGDCIFSGSASGYVRVHLLLFPAYDQG
jgi:di- and tripeptidase